MGESGMTLRYAILAIVFGVIANAIYFGFFENGDDEDEEEDD